MKGLKKILTAGILVIVFFSFGCKKTSEPGISVSDTIPNELAGYWSAAWDGFQVDKNVNPPLFTYYCDTENHIALKGEILEVLQYGDSYYLPIKITESSASCGSWATDYSYFTVGKYSAVRYMDLTATSIKQTTPYSATHPVSFDTKDDAVNTLIKSSNAVSTYFGMLGSYTK